MESAQGRQIEAIRLATFGTGARVVGLTSVRDGAGVSGLAVALAQHCVPQGPVVLVRLCDPPAAVPAQATHWGPSERALLRHAQPDPFGFDRLTVLPAAGLAPAFRNAGALRGMFDRLRERYASIVVDLAPVDPREPVAVPATTAAPACESVVMVCRANRDTQSGARQAAEALRQAGAPIQGVVINDRFNPTVAEQWSAGVRRIAHLAPELAARTLDRIRRAPLLNSRS